jgi:ribosome assembly protein 1
LYFSPEKGNVIFASASDGWAFRTSTFASIYAAKLGIKESILCKVLWGYFFFDPKSKKVFGASKGKEMGLKPMFVQFVLENIWAVYRSVMNRLNFFSLIYSDLDKMHKIIETLKLKVNPRDLKSKDKSIVITSIMSQWLPLSPAVLLSVIQIIPSPLEAQPQKFAKLTNSASAFIQKSVSSCSTDLNAPVVVYVSKMYNADSNSLPGKKQIKLTPEQMKERKALLLAHQNDHDKVSESINGIKLEETGPAEQNILVGFARIYSGVLKVGQEVYVLGPKYDPKTPELHCTKVQIERLFIMMGRDLEDIQSIGAGNVFAIGGLENSILKSGTLSSTQDCPSFGSITNENVPILRVALEAANPCKCLSFSKFKLIHIY